MIDPHVIQLCLKGERSGHQLLYKGSAPYAFSVARRYIKNQEDCKDVMQEAYANVFTHIKQYDASKGPFKFWLRRIVINCSLKHRNRRRSFLTVEMSENESPVDDSYLESVNLTREEIEQLLREMPTRYKIIFMLIIMDGFTHQEVAEQLNITAETSRSQLTRAKQWLRKHLEGSSKWEKYGLL